MWIITSVICFYSMMLSPDKPLCWKDAVVPMEFKNETSCILVRDQLAKDLNIDLNARNIRMILKCEKFKETEEIKPLLKPLSTSLTHELNYMTL